jgi:hypothetical protein
VKDLATARAIRCLKFSRLPPACKRRERAPLEAIDGDTVVNRCAKSAPAPPGQAPLAHFLDLAGDTPGQLLLPPLKLPATN